MIHKDTDLHLSQRPIILITGANGSGKTQLLDALLICLGHHPKRLKKGSVNDIIGKFDTQTKITLVLHNPIQGSTRSIPVPDKTILEYINFDTFQIQVTIQKDKGINYAIHANDITHNVSRKQIRQIFESLNIRADNKLAFTEEGTVNIFADHTPKNKLDLLLETTGLTAYKNNLIEAMETISKASHSITPLKRKYQVEQEYLYSMEKTRKILEQKSQLLESLQLLQIEEAWTQVKNTEITLQDIDKKIKQKTNEENKYNKEHVQEKETQQQIKKILEEQKLNYETIQTTIRKNQELEQWLQGKNQSAIQQQKRNNQRLQNLQNKKNQILEQQEIFLQNLQGGMGEENQQQTIYEKLQIKLQTIQEQQKKLTHITEQLPENFHKEQHKQERDSLQESLQFIRILQENHVSYTGPLYWEIAQCDWAKKNLQAYTALLYPYTYSILIHNKASYEKAHTLWQETKPNLHIIFFAKTKTQTIETYLQMFYKNILQAKIQDIEPCPETYQHANMIYVNDAIYQKWPSIGNNNFFSLLPSTFPFTLEELQNALNSVELQKNLQQQEKQIKEQIYQNTQLQPIQERIQELDKDQEQIQKEMQENEQEIVQIQNDLQTQSMQLKETKDILNNAQQQNTDTGKKIFHLEKQIEAIYKTMEILQTSKQETEQQYIEQKNHAEELGERPETIRDIYKITQEKHHIQGQLDTLQITTLTETDYQNQKKRVEQLQQEINGTESHLQNLKQDIQTRYNQWHSEVSLKINGITQTMNQLLAPIHQSVKLQIENLQQPDNAGLNILVQRYTSNWHPLSQLSGGEKVLTVEALILALHQQTDSPLHAIDECTQRLDLQFKTQAFQMVQHTLQILTNAITSPYSPQFILLAPDTIGVDFPPETEQYFQRIVLSPQKLVFKE